MPRLAIDTALHGCRTPARRAILLGALVAAHLCLSADAWAQPNLQRPTMQRPVWDDDHGQRQRLVVLQGIVVAYMFVLGATFGSFLNVVIYRLPRGLNIVRPRSRCPCCATPIELRDNIPVLSWLRLRGRCRICGVGISPRYVLVETAVGLLFVGLVVVQVLSGGANLPLRLPSSPADLFLSNWSAAGQLFALSLLHACLIATLWVAALIQLDRQPVPLSLWKAALIIALVFPAIWPNLRPVPALVDGTTIPSAANSGSPILPGVARGAVRTAALPARPWWEGIVAGATGLFVGAILGSVLSLAVGRGSALPRASHAVMAAITLVGACLGWQAAVSVAAMSAIGQLLTVLLGRLWPAAAKLPPVFWPGLATLLQIVRWKSLAEISIWPGPFTPPAEMLCWAGGIAVVSGIAWLLAPAIELAPEPH